MKSPNTACEHDMQRRKCPDCELDMIAACSKPMIIWKNPTFASNFGPIYSLCTPEVAILIMQEIHPELSNQDALDEFLTVYCASRELVDMRPFEGFIESPL